MTYCSADWGDYDNDGDLDLIITGDEFDNRTFVYKNIGNDSLIEVETQIEGVYSGIITWGDYDNDYDLDILLSGAQGNPTDFIGITKIYENIDNYDLMSHNTGIASGDFDNDGDKDIIIGSSILINSQLKPGTPTGLTLLCINSLNTTYNSELSSNIDSLIWSVTPDSAGIINSDGTTATIDWSDTFTGTIKISVTGQDDCGQVLASDSLTVEITICTAINEFEQNGIKIFPNPSKDIINIQFEKYEQLKIEIFNINGQLVYSAEIENKEKLELDSGIYLIRIKGENFAINKRIIINK